MLAEGCFWVIFRLHNAGKDYIIPAPHPPMSVIDSKGREGLNFWGPSCSRNMRSPQNSHFPCVVHHPKPLSCQWNPTCTSARGFCSLRAKDFAPSPNHFREFPFFGQLARSTGSQTFGHREILNAWPSLTIRTQTCQSWSGGGLRAALSMPDHVHVSAVDVPHLPSASAHESQQLAHRAVNAWKSKGL